MRHERRRRGGRAPGRARRLVVLVAVLLSGLTAAGDIGSTDASYVDQEHAKTTFTAATLAAITPTVVPSSTSAAVSWTGFTGTSSTTTYTLNHATSSSGTGSATVSPGTATTASDTGGLASTASTSTYASHLTAGGSFTCAIESGSVYCWGANASGQANGGTTGANRTTPTLVTLPGTASAVSAGETHACAIVTGSVYCWGDNSTFALGGSSTTTPVAGLLGGKTVTAISAGLGSTCAIAAAKAYCWGDDTLGHLGNSSTTSTATPQAVALPAGSVTSVSAGSGTTGCAVVDLDAYCWGGNASGQVGDNTLTDRSTPVAVNSTAGDGAMSGNAVGSVTAGDSHTCALTEGGVFCWGLGTSGQLGNAASTTFFYPRPVQGTSTAKVLGLSAWGGHTCAVYGTNLAYCWGVGTGSELGNGASTSSTVPVAVTATGVLSGVSVTAVATGDSHSCALGGGTVSCWGTNTSAALGNGTTTTSNVPVASTTPTVTGCASGASLLAGSTCSLAPSTSYWWQLGYTYGPWTAPTSAWTGATTTARPATTPSSTGVTSGSVDLAWSALTPSSLQTGRYLAQRATDASGSNLTTIANSASLSVTDPGTIAATYGQPPFTKISTGYGSTCGIAVGKAYCWGYNLYGQLGDGTTTERRTPGPVAGLEGHTVTKISVGGDVSALEAVCAIADGSLYCWGYNADNKLGDGTTSNRSIPGLVSGLSGTVTDVDVGDHHVCAVAGARLYCWGHDGFGELGSGAHVDKTTPYLVPTLTSVTAVSTGYGNTCAIAGGFAYCWGWGHEGQSGNGDASGTDVYAPAGRVSGGALPTGDVVKSITTGSYFACAIASDDNPYCWGEGDVGRMGNGTTTHANNRPVAVTRTLVGNGTSTQIGAGYDSACVDSGGETYCWGQNGEGTLGNNSNLDSTSPVRVVDSGTAGALPPAATPTDLSVGFGTACVIASSLPYCWGYGGSGQLGNNSVANTNDPTAPSAFSVYYCPLGSVTLGSAYCSLASATTYYYRVQYFLGAWAGPVSSWVPVTTS